MKFAIIMPNFYHQFEGPFSVCVLVGTIMKTYYNIVLTPVNHIVIFKWYTDGMKRYITSQMNMYVYIYIYIYIVASFLAEWLGCLTFF